MFLQISMFCDTMILEYFGDRTGESILDIACLKP